MIDLNRVIARVLLGLTLVTVVACTQPDEHGGAETQGAKAPPVPALAGDALEAVDLLIAMNSLSSARGWNRTLDLSPGLREQLSKYDGKVQFDVQIKGVNEPLLADGAKTEIPAGAKFGGKLTGALNAEVSFVVGEVGVVKGKVFVSEGTEATVNGDRYKYANGKWIQIGAESK